MGYQGGAQFRNHWGELAPSLSLNICRVESVSSAFYQAEWQAGIAVVEDQLMFDYEYALTKAKEYLEDSEIPLQITYEGEFAEGWFFCYQSAEYLRTGDSSDQLAGNSPFLIDRNTGELFELGTVKPITEYIDDYLQERYAS